MPNFLWLTDITEFRLPTGRKVYLSAIRDCFDSSIVAWRAGERPDADLANSTLSPRAARCLIARIVDMPIISFPASLSRLPKQ